MTDTTILLIIFIVLVIAAAFLFLWRRRDAGTGEALEASRDTNGPIDSGADAIEDVVDQFLGIDSNPDLPADELTRLKGLGPKAAAQLNALGITRYDQLAALDSSQVAAIDSRMGTFKGRIHRDKWSEQARHLAEGDQAGFEEKFGKLG